MVEGQEDGIQLVESLFTIKRQQKKIVPYPWLILLRYLSRGTVRRNLCRKGKSSSLEKIQKIGLKKLSFQEIVMRNLPVQ